MSIYLGNIQFNEIEDKLGFRLTENDKELWSKYHNDKADLSGMDNCFHVFDIPRCIKIKGDEMKSVILEMFDSKKLVSPKGRIAVYEQA